MVATLGGLLALPLGLAVLLLPLLATELSRPRDSAWGALVLLLGLVLVTSADRLSGAPMLGVVCAALLIGRLGVEVGLGRWRQLSDEERQRLGSTERWSTSFSQLGATLAQAGQQLGSLAANLGDRLGRARSGTAPAGGAAAAPRATAGGSRGRSKRWVRPEPAPSAEPASSTPQAPSTATAGPAQAPDPATVPGTGAIGGSAAAGVGAASEPATAAGADSAAVTAVAAADSNGDDDDDGDGAPEGAAGSIERFSEQVADVADHRPPHDRADEAPAPADGEEPPAAMPENGLEPPPTLP
jgi:hypothetical protein